MNAVAKSAVVALSVGFAAAVIFGIGMTGPLTPSEGHPSLLAWLVFSIVPLLLTLIGTVVAKSWLVKIALLAEGFAILLWTIELLHVHQVLPQKFVA
jgi:hypothetical protein